ncbi:MAG: PqqD family protein [Deltaproteobacteria bacterium]|nr:PqqD family protein [Deltaproteobacteria bacterium]
MGEKTQASASRCRYELSPDIAWRKIGGEAFLITRDGALTHRLNGTATRILELVLNDKTTDEIVATLTAEFSGAPDAILRDVDDLMTEMVSRGVLVKGGG